MDEAVEIMQLSTKSCQSVDEAGEIMHLSTKSPLFVDKFKKNDLNHNQEMTTSPNIGSEITIN